MTEVMKNKAENSEREVSSTEVKKPLEETLEKKDTQVDKKELTENAKEEICEASGKADRVDETVETKAEVGWDAPVETKTEVGWNAPSETKAEVGWDAPAETKAEVGWDAPAETKTEVGWDAPVETKTEGGWGEVNTSAWDVPISNTETESARETNDYRNKEGDRSYNERNNSGDYPRKRFDRESNSRGESSYGQEKRFRSDRENDRYGDDRRGGYQPREREYGSRDRNYESRDRDYQPRNRDYGSREREYQPREREYVSRDRDYQSRDKDYGSRDRDYQPRDRDYQPRDRDYQSRDRDYGGDRRGSYGSRDSGYERSAGRDRYDRNGGSYGQAPENRQRSYDAQPKKPIPANVPPSRTLGLFGLSLYATEDDLREFLAEELPDIKDYKLTIITDYETKKSRGFGFVYFNCLEDSIKAKDFLKGKSIKGKEIRIDYSVSDVLRPNYH